MGNKYTEELMKNLTKYAENKRGLESLDGEKKEYLDDLFGVERAFDETEEELEKGYVMEYKLKGEYTDKINKANLLIFKSEAILTNVSIPVEDKYKLVEELRNYIGDM